MTSAKSRHPPDRRTWAIFFMWRFQGYIRHRRDRNECFRTLQVQNPTTCVLSDAHHHGSRWWIFFILNPSNHDKPMTEDRGSTWYYLYDLYTFSKFGVQRRLCQIFGCQFGLWPMTFDGRRVPQIALSQILHIFDHSSADLISTSQTGRRCLSTQQKLFVSSIVNHEFPPDSPHFCSPGHTVRARPKA